jgi:hypothetical protein|tara:strand:- start:32517 stop:34490 length:1974 start_codon:yes stop_codon:yes gene_type:complete
MSSETSGWYARLDHECPDRTEQIGVWLDSWMVATVNGQPVAAALPGGWPTLPAGLVSNPGTVLDHLLARHAAESDGRSPRGVYATPAKFIDAILYDELNSGRSQRKEPPATLSLAALPPSFRAFAEQFNEDIRGHSANDEPDASDLEGKTESGIPLPFADPCVGAGLIAERILRIHAERSNSMSAEKRKEDTLRLLEGMQLVDSSEIAVESARKRLLIVLARLGLVDLEGEGGPEEIGRVEADLIIESNVRCADPLRGEWPWNEKPKLVVSRPPWLRIKDRFRGHPEGSKMRKELSKELRQFKEADGSKRFSAIKGNVNLYRLYIERSLQLSSDGGRVRLVVPDSVLREKSSAPLRKILVQNHEWESVWSFRDNSQFLFGASQGVAVLGIRARGSTEVLTSFGPLIASDIRHRNGLDVSAPFLELERGPWSMWTDANWAVPIMPRDNAERTRTLRAIGALADKPRLVEGGTWLNPNGSTIKVRVGEVDRSSWSESIKRWNEDSLGIPFIRGTHIEMRGEDVLLVHPAFDHESSAENHQWQAKWEGPKEMCGGFRIACQTIVNPQIGRRLLWVVIPPGCVLGNSVSFLELPADITEELATRFGNIERGMEALTSQLNSEDLGLWSKAWAANNNVNNYEIETLPFSDWEELGEETIFGS